MFVQSREMKLERLMSLPEDSHAKTFPQQGKRLVSMGSELDYFLKSFDCLARFDQDTQSWKTAQTCLLVTGEVGQGAPHERERVYIIATDANCGIRSNGVKLFFGRRFTCSAETAQIIAYDYHKGKLQSGWSFRDKRGWVVYDPKSVWTEAWNEKLSQLCSVDDGLPCGLSTATSERFGNSVVPQIPELIGRAIIESMRKAA